MSDLAELENRADRRREPIPRRALPSQRSATQRRERIELRAAVVLALAPLRRYPAVLLELVQGGVERPVADLEHLARDGLESLAHRPAVGGLEREHLEDQEVERALYQVSRFAHERYSTWLPMGRYHATPR